MGRMTKTGVSCEAGGAGGGGAGNVASVVAGANISVDATDPDNPIVAVSSGTGTGNIVRATSPTLTTPNIGTPSAGTLTNCTGLPQAGTVGLTTADSPQFTALNIGHASDTTVTRVSAGVIAVEGQSVVTVGNGLQADKAAVPLSSKTAAYTTVLGDANTTILHPSSDNNARTFTIDSNANVAYPTGTMITFVNRVNTVTIAITSDTMYLAGAGTTGSRTLAAHGVATAIKTGSTEWVISGTGLT